MPTTSAVFFAIGAHFSPEAGAGVGSSAGSIVVALGGTNGDGAVEASVSGQACTAIEPVVTHHSPELAGTLVERAQVPAIHIVYKLAHRTSWPCVVRVAHTLSESADTVAVTVGRATTVSLHTRGKALLGEVIIGAQPLHRDIEAVIHILEEPPAAVLRVAAGVRVVAGQHDGVVEQHLHVGQVDLPHLDCCLHPDLQAGLRGSLTLKALPRFVAHQGQVVLAGVVQVGADSGGQLRDLCSHSINNVGEAHAIIESDGEVRRNRHCIHIVGSVLTCQDPARGVGIHCLRAHHHLQPSAAAEYAPPDGGYLIGPKAQVAEACLCRVRGRQAECNSLCLRILSSGEKTAPDFIGILDVDSQVWLEGVEDQLCQFGHVVISGQMGDADPDVLAQRVGKTDGLLPRHAILGVGPMGQQGSVFPGRVRLSVGVGPVHKPQCAKGLKFLQHEWTEVDCLPDALISGSDHADVPDVVAGVGPSDCNQDAVVETGGGNHIQLHPANPIPYCRHVLHAKLQNTVTVVQHHVCSVVVVGVYVTGNERAHLDGRRKISGITISIKRDLVLKGFSRAPSFVGNEVDPGTALPLHIDEGVLGCPVADALQVHPHLVLGVGRSVHRAVTARIPRITLADVGDAVAPHTTRRAGEGIGWDDT